MLRIPIGTPTLSLAVLVAVVVPSCIFVVHPDEHGEDAHEWEGFAPTSVEETDARPEAASASKPDPRAEVTSALERYMVAARAVDADAIAQCFTEHGTLFEPGILPIQGREPIRDFIRSFPGVRVEVATATPDAIETFDTTAYVWGTYFERLDFPGQQLSEQSGKFVIEWNREADGEWRILRYYRIPLPPGTGAGAPPR